MQGTAHFHHEVTYSLFCEANDFFGHATTLDAAVDMLDSDSTLRDQAIFCFLLGREFTRSRLFRGHDGFYSFEGESLEAQILQ